MMVREYTVIKPLPVRDGVTAPMLEVSGVNTGKVYSGNQQQYEFIEYLGGRKWEQYMSIQDKNGILLK